MSAGTFHLLDAQGRPLPERCVICGGPQHEPVKAGGMTFLGCPGVPDGLLVTLPPRTPGLGGGR